MATLFGAEGAQAGVEAELDPAGLLECDPSPQVGFRPQKVYNTPVVIKDTTDSYTSVLVWSEGELAASNDSSYYFVKFTGAAGSPRTCEVRVEGSAPAAFLLDLPSPSDAAPGETEVVRAAPVLVPGAGGRTLYMSSSTGHFNRYAIGADGLPSEDTGDSSTDTTPESDPAAPLTYDPGGPDTSAFVEPNLGVVVKGHRCAADPGTGATDCEGDSDPARYDATWGEIHAHDLDGLPLSVADLDAWTFSAPVGLSTQFNPQTEQDELLMVLGTFETTTDESSDYDCALVSVLWDGSSLMIPAGGAFNDGDTACAPPGSTPAVDGFTGEPVPHSVRDLYALRYFGRLYRTTWNTAGALSKTWDIQFVQTDREFRIPAEMSPVIGTYPPGPPVLPGSGSLDRVMFGMNEYDTAGALLGGKFVAVDPQDDCITTADPDLHCERDPTTHLIGEIPALSGNSVAVWAPGAAAVYRSDTPDPDYYLAYVTVTGAVTDFDPAAPPVGEDCDRSAATSTLWEKPARLHIYWQDLTSAFNDWNHHYIDLFDYSTGAVPRCYTDPDGTGSYVPITAISGVVVKGTSVYVATNDGRFWEYNTWRAVSEGSGHHVLEGYSGPWPRSRAAARTVMTPIQTSTPGRRMPGTTGSTPTATAARTTTRTGTASTAICTAGRTATMTTRCPRPTRRTSRGTGSTRTVTDMTRCHCPVTPT